MQVTQRERETGGVEWLRAGVESEGECAGDSERVTGGVEWLRAEV